MKHYKIHVVALAAVSLLIISCTEQDERKPLNYNGAVPSAVSDVTSESLPGSVRLTYKVPKDNNILYVMARCNINGVIREVKASAYVDNLLIEGFADTELKEVEVYAVSRSEVMSKPVIVEVTPLTPPFQKVFQSLDLMSDFGGVSVGFQNPDEADLAIYIIHDDGQEGWVTAETAYTKRRAGFVSARGLAAKPLLFGTFIKDRWNNYTDTLFRNLTPIFEKQLDRSKFREVNLPGDEPSAWGWTLPHIWDGSIVWDSGGEVGFHTDVTSRWPQHFTMDLGVEAVLSRFKFWQRGWVGFNDRNIRKFEIWGSTDPSSDGSFDDSWVLLSTCESVKPSGLPAGQLSEEDIAVLQNGEEFPMEPGAPLVRYIRVRVTETWSKAECFFLLQVAFFGAEAGEL